MTNDRGLAIREWAITGALVLSAIAVCIAVVQRVSFAPGGRPIDPPWQEIPTSLVDKPAPTFSLETMAGDTIQLPTNGTSSIIVAYRTTCEWCDASVPVWRRLAMEVCDVLIVFASAEPVETQAAYWQSKDWSPGHGCAHSVAGRVVEPLRFRDSYGVRGTPTQYILDRSGRVRRIWGGAALSTEDGDALAAAVQFDGG